MPVTHRWYVGFHGGEGRHDRNNLHAYDAAGRPLGPVLATDSLPPHVALRELRGFAWGPDGDLYVADAYRGASRILRFGGRAGPDGRHPFVAVFAAQGAAADLHHGRPVGHVGRADHQGKADEPERPPTHPGLAHPFDVEFGPDGNLYVPAQDTRIVARCWGPLVERGGADGGSDGGGPGVVSAEAEPGAKVHGAPMPHPPALADLDLPPGRLHPGTFDAAAGHVPAPAGLRQVRHARFGPGGDLFVADRAAGRVKRYDGQSGELRAELGGDRLPTPIHLLFPPAPAGRLLVGSRDADAVVALDPDGGAVATLVAPGAGGLRQPAGLALGPDGLLYVASRGGHQVLRFDPETGRSVGEPFLDRLPDAPEFIRLVPDGV